LIIKLLIEWFYQPYFLKFPIRVQIRFIQQGKTLSY
jgi:hypothetical protein